MTAVFAQAFAVAAAKRRALAKRTSFSHTLSLTGSLEEIGDQELAALFAGQSAALTREMPASDLVETLATETSQCLRWFD